MNAINIYDAHQSVGVIIIICLASYLSCKVCLSYSLAMSYTAFSSLFAPTSLSSLNALVSILGVTAIAAMIKAESLHKVILAIISVLVANCFFVLIFSYGIFNQGSVDNSILAIALPVLYWKFDIMRKSKSDYYWIAFIALCLSALTILVTQGSTPYFAIVAAIFAWNLRRNKFIKILVPIAFFLVAGYITQESNFIDSNGRMEKWKFFMSWWANNANIFIGYGTGSFWWKGPAIQGGTSGLFTFMHNEYLQALFEQGIIGFSLYALVFIDCLRKAWHNKALVSFLAALSVIMISQFPFRYFLSQLFIVLMIRFINEQWRVNERRRT